MASPLEFRTARRRGVEPVERHRPRRSCDWGRIRALTGWVALIAVLSLWPPPAGATPLTRPEVVKLVRRNVQEKRILDVVRELGIDFKVTADVMEELISAGASAALIAELMQVASSKDDAPLSVAAPPSVPSPPMSPLLKTEQQSIHVRDDPPAPSGVPALPPPPGPSAVVPGSESAAAPTSATTAREPPSAVPPPTPPPSPPEPKVASPVSAPAVLASIPAPPPVPPPPLLTPSREAAPAPEVSAPVAGPTPPAPAPPTSASPTVPAPRAGAVESGNVKAGPPAATSKWEAVRPLLDRAQTLVTEGDIRGAQRLVAEAMEIDPGEAEVWKAFKGIERDLLVDAETLLANGEVQRALRQFEFVIEKNPESAPGHYSKGRVLMQLKNYDEAVAALERAVTLNPGNARYRQALAQVRNLQKASRALERQGQESLQQMLGEQPGKKRGQ